MAYIKMGLEPDHLLANVSWSLLDIEYKVENKE